MKMRFWIFAVLSLLLSSFRGGLAEECGWQVGGALCPNDMCCNQYGFCGFTFDYCCHHCQSQCDSSVCPPPPPHSPPPPPPPPPPPVAECGLRAGGAVCPNNLCCSRYGDCGCSPEFCCDQCQSQCNCTVCPPSPPPTTTPIGGLISSSEFDNLLKHRNDDACPAKGFYTYDAFIAAAKAFPDFATTGDTATQKKEIAAFLGQTSHETTGGWATAPDGPYAWGYCFLREQNPVSHCASNPTYPCAPGQQYYGRGPIQLSWNYNYGMCGTALGVDLLNNPDLLATDPVISFKSALWFWMTPQSPKPSCHDVITGRWNPSDADKAAGRDPGYGVVTNIINGGLECGKGWNEKVENRIGFFKRYCDVLGADYGSNLDCYNQEPFGKGLLVDTM